MTASVKQEPKSNALRDWRLGARFTLEDESGLTGYSTGYLSLIERGLRTPSPRAKVHIARSLGVAVAEIFPPVLPQAVDDADA